MGNTIKKSLPVILLGMLLLFNACEKEVSNAHYMTDPDYLSDDVILDLAEDALRYESAGLLFELKLMGEIGDRYLKDENAIPVCGVRFQENVSDCHRPLFF